MNGDPLYLQHVFDAVGKIERYIVVGHEEFMVAPHWQDLRQAVEELLTQQ